MPETSDPRHPSFFKPGKTGTLLSGRATVYYGLAPPPRSLTVAAQEDRCYLRLLREAERGCVRKVGSDQTAFVIAED